METKDYKLWVSLCENPEAIFSLRTAIKKFFKNDYDVDDILNDILIKLYKNFPKKLATAKNYKGYLYFVARNHCVDIYRKDKSKSLYSGTSERDWQNLPDKQLSFEDQEILDQRAKRLALIIDNFSKGMEQVVQLRLDEVPYTDISKEIGYTEGAARSSFRKAKEYILKRF